MQTAVIIPTLNAQQARIVGETALEKAGCPARLIVVDGPERGFTKTVNEGLRLLRPHEDVCLLNDDVIVSTFPDDWLLTLQTALYSRPRYGIVGPRRMTGEPQEQELQPCTTIAFWCVLIKRALLDEIGHLDEQYIHYASDDEYCLRAQLAGWLCVRVRALALGHTLRGSGKRENWWRRDLAIWEQVKRTQGAQVYG